MLNTVAHVMRHTWVDKPELTDSKGWVRDNFPRDFEMTEKLRREVSTAWNDGVVEIPCRVCDSITLFVKVEPLTPARRALRVLAAECPLCGLSIQEGEPYLAECHVGPLPEDVVEAFLKDIGE